MALSNAHDAPVADAQDAVVALVASHPERHWRTSDIVRGLEGYPVLDVVMAVAALHRSGGLERVAVATYRHPSDAHARIAERNERHLWGV